MIEKAANQTELAAPCGLYCGVCGIHMAHANDDLEFKERLAEELGLTVEDIKCEGCRSDVLFEGCKSCGIRSCVAEKAIEGCHQCNDFPCRHIVDYPLHYGRRVMERAVPDRRALGVEEWIGKERRRYRCPYCGGKAYMGAKECWDCREPVDID